MPVLPFCEEMPLASVEYVYLTAKNIFNFIKEIEDSKEKGAPGKESVKVPCEKIEKVRLFQVRKNIKVILQDVSDDTEI